MQGMTVTLPEMLDAREARAFRQQSLREKFQCPMICFTMNIAGPVKNNDLIRRGFSLGVSRLKFQLKNMGMTVLYTYELNEKTGNEFYCMVKGDLLSLKRITTEIEDHFALGRLYDMDVLDENGQHVDRRELELSERTCLICGRPAKECSRSRFHTVEELQNRTEEMLVHALAEEDAAHIAELACRSLLYEVCTTPKPGLVDCANSGSHRDMDLFTFVNSSSALWPYFHTCAKTGIETAEEDAGETFRKIRSAGREAEYRMFSSTGGINTHKGAVFSMGILCAALGRLPHEQRRMPERVLAECAAMTRGIVERDFRNVTLENAVTAGQRYYAAYGITGVRGQAEAGYPAILHHGLPVLEKGLSLGLDHHRAGAAALLSLLAHSTDTNLITRSSWERQLEVTEQVRALLDQQEYPDLETLRQLDQDFIRENLSPGGSADLLAMTWMLHFFRNEDRG